MSDMNGKKFIRRFIVAKNKKLKIIPLGGLNEIGKNFTVVE